MLAPADTAAETVEKPLEETTVKETAVTDSQAMEEARGAKSVNKKNIVEETAPRAPPMTMEDPNIAESLHEATEEAAAHPTDTDSLNKTLTKEAV